MFGEPVHCRVDGSGVPVVQPWALEPLAIVPPLSAHWPPKTAVHRTSQPPLHSMTMLEPPVLLPAPVQRREAVVTPTEHPFEFWLLDMMAPSLSAHWPPFTVVHDTRQPALGVCHAGGPSVRKKSRGEEDLHRK